MEQFDAPEVQRVAEEIRRRLTHELDGSAASLVHAYLVQPDDYRNGFSGLLFDMSALQSSRKPSRLTAHSSAPRDGHPEKIDRPAGRAATALASPSISRTAVARSTHPLS